MNCQDISRTLESGNVNALGAAERQACEAHAASCPHCGPEWVVYTRLAAITVPAMPPLLISRCEALLLEQPTAAQQRGGRGGVRRRFVLIGALVALSAAAAMLEVVPRVVAVAAAPELPDESLSSSMPASETASTGEDSPATASPARFTVHLRTLRYDSTDAAAQQKVQEYHALLAEGLRAIPGLQLLDDQAAERSGVPASFRIAITSPDATMAQQALSQGYWAAMYRVEVLQPATQGMNDSSGAVYVPAEGFTRGGVNGPETFAGKSILVPHSGACPSLILCTPQSIAEWQIKDLRMQVFPLDGSVQRDLEARFLDPSLSVPEHLQALNDLQAVTKRAAGPMSDAVVREALLRADRSRDSEERNLYWTFLIGQKHPDMVPPLADMAIRDPEDAARLEAVQQLADEFRDDPAARAVLQSVARNDRKQLNRKVAERALLGDGVWNEYVLATIKDDSQTSRQRLEPLRWMLGQSMPVAPLVSAVFAADRQVFIDLLVQADKELQSGFVTRALGAVASVKHPDTAGFLLAVFDTAPDYNRLRLLESHLNDPAVRARVEAIAADPSDETLQVAAAGMLERSKVTQR